MILIQSGINKLSSAHPCAYAEVQIYNSLLNVLHLLSTEQECKDAK